MINKFGLYENIVPRYRISGLKSSSLDNQTQGWWLPFFKNGELYLVDTYHISDSIHRSIEKFVEENENDQDNSWLVNRSDSDYYYGGSVKITPATEGYFREVCDLRYFEITRDDPNDYNEEDIIRNVKLYFEHGYPSGVTLKRKDASKSINKQALNKMYTTLNYISISWIDKYSISELEDYANNPDVDEKIRLKLKAAIKRLEKAIECNEMLNEAARVYREEIRKIDGE